MQAVMKTVSGSGLDLVETDIPTIGPDDVLVQVRATSICGTDLHIRRWDTWASGRVRPPLIVGHEMCGEVVAVGKRVTTVATSSPPRVTLRAASATNAGRAMPTSAATPGSWGSIPTGSLRSTLASRPRMPGKTRPICPGNWPRFRRTSATPCTR